jgi:hypothetical protein
VAIEHREADPITIVCPYSKRRSGGSQFDSLIATPGEHNVFSGN